MRKTIAIVLMTALFAALVLTGCGKKAVFGVTTDEDNTIRVTAEKGPAESAGIGYLTVGENENIRVEAAFQEGEQIQLRVFAGVLGDDNFPDEPMCVTVVSGSDTAEFGADPGEYTIGVKALTKTTGSAKISAVPGPEPEQAEVPAEIVPDTPDEEPAETPAPAEQPAAAPVEDDGYYSGLSSMPKGDLEAYAAQVKQEYLEHDWAAIAAKIRYPINMYRDVTCNNADEFLSYMQGKTVHVSDMEAMAEENCHDMFYNGQGLCLGAGEVWILDLSYMTDKEPELVIIALSGIVPEDEATA